ncbi:MAG: delta-60 repeat domain-containing protein [Chloroflexota bacterium]
MKQFIGLLSIVIVFSSFWAFSSFEQTKAMDLYPACQTNGHVWEVLYHDGVYFVGGAFTAVRPAGEASGGPNEVVRRGLAACDAQSGEVLSWNPELNHPDPSTVEIRGFGLSPDGNTLYAGGKFRTVGATTRLNAAAFDIRNLDNAIITPWDPNLTGSAKARAFAATDDVVYVGGNFDFVGGQPQKHLARVNATTGALDTSFAPTISYEDLDDGCTPGNPNPRIFSLVLAGNVLFMGGRLTAVNDAPRSGAAAINVDSGLVTEFAPNIVDTKEGDCTADIYKVIASGPYVYLCGDWWHTENLPPLNEPPGGDGFQRNINRFSPNDGEADLDWMPWTDGGVQTCALDLDNDQIIIGGHFDAAGSCDLVAGEIQCREDPDGHDDLAAIALDSGAIVSSWNPSTQLDPCPAVGCDIGVWGMVVQNGRLFLGGLFTHIDGVAQDNLALIDTPANDRDVLFVVGDSDNLTGGDRAVQQRLENELGLSVRMVSDENSDPEQAAMVRLVVISASTSSSLVQDKFRNAPVPVVLWKPTVLDDMGMTGPTFDSDHGTLEAMEITITNPSHPLAAGLSGTVTLFAEPELVTWGVAGGDGIVVAEKNGRSVFFAYRAGDELWSGETAVGCRIATPWHRASPETFTQAGWLLFDNTIEEALAGCEWANNLVNRTYLPIILK